MRPKTVLEAYQKFTETEACQSNSRLKDNLRTVLRRYILPCYGFEVTERCSLENYLNQLPLETLLKDAAVRVKELNPGSRRSSGRAISSGTIQNYRSTLVRFLGWIHRQQWNNVVTPNEGIPTYAPTLSSGQTLTKSRQREELFSNKPYALKEEELTASLKSELAQLAEFWTTSNASIRQENVISEATFTGYQNSLLCILGWQHNFQNQSLEELSLERVTNLEQLERFIEWGRAERGNSTGWAVNIVRSIIAVTKWLASQELSSKYHLPIKQLQYYLKTFKKAPKIDTKRHETATPEETEKILEYLKESCAPRHRSGKERSETAVMKAWQRYLIIALLIYSPLRQQEIRKLELNSSLVRRPKGYWVRISQFKTAGKSESLKEFFLPSHLTSDLDIWLKNFRSKIKTSHDYIFIRTGSGRSLETLGEPLSARDTSLLISNAIYKATSVQLGVPKRITPHSVRHIGFAHYQMTKQSGAEPLLETDRLVEPVNEQTSHSLLSHQLCQEATEEWWHEHTERPQIQQSSNEPPKTL